MKEMIKINTLKNGIIYMEFLDNKEMRNLLTIFKKDNLNKNDIDYILKIYKNKTYIYEKNKYKKKYNLFNIKKLKTEKSIETITDYLTLNILIKNGEDPNKILNKILDYKNKEYKILENINTKIYYDFSYLIDAYLLKVEKAKDIKILEEINKELKYIYSLNNKKIEIKEIIEIIDKYYDIME